MEQAISSLLTQGGAIAAMLVLAVMILLGVLWRIFNFMEHLVNMGMASLNAHTTASVEMFHGLQQMNKEITAGREVQAQHSAALTEALTLLRKLNGRS